MTDSNEFRPITDENEGSWNPPADRKCELPGEVQAEIDDLLSELGEVILVPRKVRLYSVCDDYYDSTNHDGRYGLPKVLDAVLKGNATGDQLVAAAELLHLNNPDYSLPQALQDVHEENRENHDDRVSRVTQYLSSRKERGSYR